VLQVPPRHAVSTAARRHRHRADQDVLSYPIEKILRALPRAHREILIATYFRRQTTREAAQQLNIPHEDARRRVYEATRELTGRVGAAKVSSPYELPPTDPDRWRRGAFTS
jgi:DNA-directed RNA polymerase specialized sigma24 family protein